MTKHKQTKVKSLKVKFNFELFPICMEELIETFIFKTHLADAYPGTDKNLFMVRK